MTEIAAPPAEVTAAGAGRGDLEFRLRGAGGVYRWFKTRGLPVRDGAGQVNKWCGVMADIEDSRRQEEKLRERELDFQLVVDSIPIPVAVTSPSGEVESLNQPTLDYFDRIWKSSAEGAVFVFDDIRWSIGMERAWNRLKVDPRLAIVVDLSAGGDEEVVEAVRDD